MQVGSKAGWVVDRLLAGVVMIGWLLMAVGILMVFFFGASVLLLRWLVLLGRQRDVVGAAGR